MELMKGFPPSAMISISAFKFAQHPSMNCPMFISPEVMTTVTAVITSWCAIGH